MPKVSIIIPVYNVEKYLRKCLDSVVNQILLDIEIICVNDCSPDDSLSILKEYADKDSRIKLIDLKENVGSGQARNIAMEQATGEYIMFVDSDDWLELDACEKVYDRINTNQSDVCFFTYNFYDEKTDRLRLNKNKLMLYEKYADDSGRVHLEDINFPYILSAEVWYKIYKRSFLEKYSLKMISGKCFEDTLFSNALLMYAKNISILNLPLYNYRVNNKSSITNNAKYYTDYIYSREKTFDEILKNYADKRYFSIYSARNILSWFHWYRIFTRKNKRIKEEFYQHMRNMVIKTNEHADMEYVKKYIDYSRFKAVLKCKSHYSYDIFDKFLFNIFHIQDDIFRKKYTILFVKFSVKQPIT